MLDGAPPPARHVRLSDHEIVAVLALVLLRRLPSRLAVKKSQVVEATLADIQDALPF